MMIHWRWSAQREFYHVAGILPTSAMREHGAGQINAGGVPELHQHDVPPRQPLYFIEFSPAA
ncbi:hypothetical protein MKP05_19445 [Halomonas sp. EGI 63088]|uniref:Uncharacterized protein n=1 Tax=Halomonas flagellata TaxID=2920385 RepID=A0ABS9RZJ3_9GAMM|nr:hypothetical protein [Halomonas flagellata]MCH4565278.1 hypothetical protein [Halomonas flagellata]